MVFLLSIILTIGLSSVAIATEDFCTDYPGDISFIYETLQDENVYNNLYGKPVIYKYKKIRTIYHPTGQRQIIQQQQQVFLPNNLNIQQNPGTNQGDKSDNDLNGDIWLPIWKVKIPKNAVQVIFERVENGTSIDKFLLSMENLENRTVPMYSLDYSRIIDVTDFGIVMDAWYSVCLSLSISVNKKIGICHHCTLIKATVTGFSDKVFENVEMPNQYTSSSIKLKYRVEDLPFPSAHVITKVYQSYDERVARCLNLGNVTDKAAAESTDLIKAHTVVYVDIAGLSESHDYFVISSLIAEWKDDIKRAPLTALFYVNPYKTQSISKCSRVSF